MAIAGLVLILLAPEIVPATGQSISPTMPPFTQPVFSMTPKSALER